jgi:hypothetical protein
MNNIQEIEPLRVSDIAQTLIFNTIWNRMPNKSFISGLWLRAYNKTVLRNNCFLFVLPSEKYRMFRYYFGNIILCTPGERSLWLNATEEERIAYALDLEEKSEGKTTADWNAVKELEKELLVLYKKSFPMTYKGIVGYVYLRSDIESIVGRLNKEFWESFKI